MNTVADPPETRHALEALLRWYEAMGVDAAVDETSHDRFRFSQAAPPTPRDAQLPRDAPSQPSRSLPPRAGTPDSVPSSAEALVREAQVLAAAAVDIEDLAARWATLPGCTLAASASRMVFAGGTAGSRLMIVGGAPEADDERQGEAFAGPRGQLLDAMLRAIGLDRGKVYLANVVPWRPPGARPPSPLELSLCLPFARRHIALAAPAVLLCLGERAAQPLLDSREPISRLRGRWLTYEGDATTVRSLVTFSPDYLLNQPLQKRRAWADLQLLATALES